MLGFKKRLNFQLTMPKSWVIILHLRFLWMPEKLHEKLNELVIEES